MPSCGYCKKSFRTLADEFADHGCPYCGYYPWDEDKYEEEIDEDEE